MTKRFLACAGLLTLAFLACHIAGFRQATCILCGTYPTAGSMMGGLVYAGVYMAFTIMAPILALGGVASFLLNKGYEYFPKGLPDDHQSSVVDSLNDPQSSAWLRRKIDENWYLWFLE